MLLAGIVLLAVLVRLAGIGDRLSEDEGFSWLVASAPSADVFLDRLAAYENTPPLFYLLLAPLPLDDEHWLRLPALVAGVACVPVLYLAVRPLLGTRAALLSALGLAVAPYAVNWSNFSRGFMVANLGLLIALWAVVQAGRRRRQALVVGLRGRRRARDLLGVQRAALPGRAGGDVRVDGARPPSRGPSARSAPGGRPAAVAR